jgi:hypothetical protein
MWTIDDINKVRAKQGQAPLKKSTKTKEVKSEAKRWIAFLLLAWKMHLGVELKTEYKFDEKRRWRADWALIDESRGLKVLIEYEGLFSKKSRHTTVGGFSSDTEKYNAAALAGWIVLRYTAKTYKKLSLDLQKLTI